QRATIYEGRNSARNTKLMSSSSKKRDSAENVVSTKAKMVEQSQAPVAVVPTPPRINAKSSRRRAQSRQYDNVPSEAAIIAAAAAAAASNDDYLDTNRHEQNPDAYFETSMDNHGYGGGQTYGNQSENYYNHHHHHPHHPHHQARTAAATVNPEGYW
ncbi:hypothetical protein BGZ80_007942, partial [Entomortierella chlamydospora]